MPVPLTIKTTGASRTASCCNGWLARTLLPRRRPTGKSAAAISWSRNERPNGHGVGDAKVGGLDRFLRCGERDTQFLGDVFHGPGVLDEIADDLVGRRDVTRVLQLSECASSFC
jgi:hypothetical protein